MTARSPYRPKLSMLQARHEVAASSGSQFDPTVATALLGMLDRMALAGSTGLLAVDGAERRPDLLS